MKITTENLIKLYEEYSDEVSLKFLSDTRIQHFSVMSGDIVQKEHVDILARTRIQYINIIYEPVSYQYLSRHFPSVYRQSSQSLSYLDFDRHMEKMDRVNLETHKKRHACIVGDLYVTEANGTRRIVLPHDEMIDYKKWNSLKGDINKKETIRFRSSETAIIVLVNLSIQGDANYVERFKKNMDLISILVSNRKCYASQISPDFVPTEDIISVTDPSELRQTYIDSQARLIIIGEKIDEAYKKALVEVKRYDKYVRMMVVPEINQSNMDHFCKEVALVYNTDRW